MYILGDKIISLTICFDNMVYEDALTLLSYASPYPITMQVSLHWFSLSNHNASSFNHVSFYPIKMQLSQTMLFFIQSQTRAKHFGQPICNNIKFHNAV